MGTVQELETFRRKRGGPAQGSRFAPDLLFSHEIGGRCPGCHARRSYLVAYHDTGTDLGTSVFGRTLPHFRCDGKKVVDQDSPDIPGFE